MRPVYHLVKGLSQKTVSKAVAEALKKYDFSEDWIPYEVREKYDLIEEETAIRQMHQPEDETEMLNARKRLAFGEFFSFLYSIKKINMLILFRVYFAIIISL